MEGGRMISASVIQQAVSSAASVDSTLLEDMAVRALAVIEARTHRYFGAIERITEVLSGSGTRLLELPQIVHGAFGSDEDDVQGVEEREFPGAPVTVFAANDFELRRGEKASYLARTGGGCWRLTWEYSVTYLRGYGDDELPEEIVQLVLDWLTLKLASNTNAGLSGETIGDYSYTKPATYAFTDGDLKQIPGALAVLDAWTPAVFA